MQVLLQLFVQWEGMFISTSKINFMLNIPEKLTKSRYSQQFDEHEN